MYSHSVSYIASSYTFYIFFYTTYFLCVQEETGKSLKYRQFSHLRYQRTDSNGILIFYGVIHLKNSEWDK